MLIWIVGHILLVISDLYQKNKSFPLSFSRICNPAAIIDRQIANLPERNICRNVIDLPGRF